MMEYLSLFPNLSLSVTENFTSDCKEDTKQPVLREKETDSRDRDKKKIKEYYQWSLVERET